MITKSHSNNIRLFPLYSVCLVFIAFFTACEKDWLEAKPNQKLVVPTSIQDFQAILDNTSMLSTVSGGGEVSSDNYYITKDVWDGLPSPIDKNSYVWDKDIFAGLSAGDWDTPYRHIFYANNVLDEIDKIKPAPSDQSSWNNVKGSALFYRAFGHFTVASLFAKTYTASTAGTDLGIILKKTADFNEVARRANLQESYDFILGDVQLAARLLPPLPSIKTRPSKAAAYALLSRICLSMERYQQAKLYADSMLQIQPNLLDYNTDVNLTANFPFPQLNSEVIFRMTLASRAIILNTRAIIDPALYASYDNNDLRKEGFYRLTNNILRYKGSYEGSVVSFGGLATDEVYLNRAEAYARLGDINNAMADLNTLMKKRWRNTVPYQNITAIDQDDAIRKILVERRKQLVFRGIRWIDLKRLNKDPKFQVTLTRDLNGQIYTLAPNSNRYVFPIPDNELLVSNVEQNPR